MKTNHSPSRFPAPSGRPDARPSALFPSGPDTAPKGKLSGKVPGVAAHKMLPGLLLQSPLWRVAAAAAVLLVPCTPCLNGATLLNLGTLPGGTSSEARAVSADGSTVVGWSGSASGNQAFRWTGDGGMVGLGGTETFSPADVSGDGSTIVGLSSIENGFVAVLWTSDGGIVDLHNLPAVDGKRVSRASAVSADGSTVAGSFDRLTGALDAELEAFRWTSGGGMVGLGDLAGGRFQSIARGISADGSTIVGRGVSGPNWEAFRWTSDGGMVGLGNLVGGDFRSEANAVSADGSTVVGFSSSYSVSGQLGFEAFRWTSGGGMVGLGHLPGEDYSEATAVSADGSTVVGGGGGPRGAFLWTEDGGMQRLWDVLLAGGVDPAAYGWTSFSFADDISADGDTIVGTGRRNDGNTAAFMVVLSGTPPPTPLAGGLLNYWPLDGDAADVAGGIPSATGATRNDGIVRGGVTFSAGRPGFGSHSVFPGGAGNHITIADPTSGTDDIDRSNADLSISIWFQLSSRNTAWQALIAHGEGTDYRLALRGGENPLQLAYAGGGAGSDIWTPTNIGPSPGGDGLWHHAVVTTSGSSTALYLDGVLEAQGGTGPINENGQNALCIGCNPTNGREWNGLIDDVGMWGRALTAGEVREIYQAGLGGKPLAVLLESGGPGGFDPAELVAPGIALSGGNVDLMVPLSVPGRRYLVETSESLTEGTWTTIGTEHVGDGGPLTISVPHDPAYPRRFYRLVLDP